MTNEIGVTRKNDEAVPAINITAARAKEDKVHELGEWKSKIDDVTSPSQFKSLVDEVQELKLFRTKAVTVFAVVQFLMAAAVAASKIF